MSKKTKWSIIGLSALLVTTIVLSLMTIFVWTKPASPAIKLETPKLTFREEDKLLISDNNLSATSYSFFIYDGNSPQETFNYIEHKTDKFYFDVTPYLTHARTYYFYCRCNGGENVENSDISQVRTYVNRYYLTEPELAIVDTELSWTNVPNASGYKVYKNDDVFITQTTERHFNIANFLDSQKMINTFYVVAVGDEHYYDSEKSNVVSHNRTITYIGEVSNFRVEEASKKLYWSAAQNANKYEVMVDSPDENFNGPKSYFTETTSFDFASLLTQNGTYTFKVRAIKDNELYSSFTESKTYTKTEVLSQVNNITSQKDVVNLGNITQQKITFNWSAVQNARYYKVVIKIDGTIQSTQNIQETSILVYRPDGASNVTIEITTLGYDYYLDSQVATKTVNF